MKSTRPENHPQHRQYNNINYNATVVKCSNMFDTIHGVGTMSEWWHAGTTQVDKRELLAWETFSLSQEHYVELLDSVGFDTDARMELFMLAQLGSGGRDAANNIIHKVHKKKAAGEWVTNWYAFVQKSALTSRHHVNSYGYDAEMAQRAQRGMKRQWPPVWVCM